MYILKKGVVKNSSCTRLSFCSLWGELWDRLGGNLWKCYIIFLFNNGIE